MEFRRDGAAASRIHLDKNRQIVKRRAWKPLANKMENADPKRLRVLEGAMKVFLAYGFARTTMDDIARAADMSRPALYLLFRNKSEIYRAIAAAML